MAASGSQTMETGHEDMVHDAVLDYYGKRLATCSSDKTIKVFAVEGQSNRLQDTLRGHEGPVWQVAWAHPKFGTILASASYDAHVIIWRDSSTSPGQSSWTKLFEHTVHTSSINSIAWAPHELGALLACASSDGKVSVLEFKDDGTWDTKMFNAHGIGVNAVSWAPALSPGSLVSTQGDGNAYTRKLATGGCDNLIKIWGFDQEKNIWVEEETLQGHTDWVRDVAFAPSIGMPKTYLASGSQDKKVIIWSQNAPGQPWQKKVLKPEPFADTVWRVNWSLSGGILAVSCGDNMITLWREGVKGEWENVQQID